MVTVSKVQEKCKSHEAIANLGFMCLATGKVHPQLNRCKLTMNQLLFCCIILPNLAFFKLIESLVDMHFSGSLRHQHDEAIRS